MRLRNGSNLAVRGEASFHRDSFVVEMAGEGLKRVAVEGVDQPHHASVRRQQDRSAVRAETEIRRLVTTWRGGAHVIGSIASWAKQNDLNCYRLVFHRPLFLEGLVTMAVPRNKSYFHKAQKVNRAKCHKKTQLKTLSLVNLVKLQIQLNWGLENKNMKLTMTCLTEAQRIVIL